jgi:OOP family OmpA-OmpF porin
MKKQWLAIAALACLGVAQAQTSNSPSRPGFGEQGWSLVPGTRDGYVGLNLGRPDHDLSCPALFDCDDPELGAHLYTGGFANDWLGAEVGYVWLGRSDRAGGRTRAQGLNLGVVLRAPLGRASVYAKGGATYGRTRVTADLLSGVDSGARSSWGPAYGAGVGFDLGTRSSVVLEWMRHEMKFPGVGGRRDVDMTSIGYVHRF